MRAAAKEIHAQYYDAQSVDGKFEASTEEQNAEIIAEHCPLSDGVAYMPVPRCDQCRHWRADDLFTPPSDTEWGGCELTEASVNRANDLTPAPERDDTRAFVPDNEYRTLLMTSADFGCVQWERKP